MRRLLWVGDAACPSGFARATHETLDVLRRTWDVTVLGLNYRGDPHSYPYPIYAASAGGDAFGVRRLLWMADVAKPDLIVIQNDPWNFQSYIQTLRSVDDYKDIPVIGLIAVDGKNCMGRALNDLSLAIFWTQFALDEARAGGCTTRGAVVPLGVDLSVYHPMPQDEARKQRKLPEFFEDKYIVGNVNRNQPRKRLDLTIRYFAEWVKSHKVDDAYLYLHVAPTGDEGFNIQGLMQYYGVANRLILMEPAMFYGLSEADMCATYGSFDVCISTTQGEGMGLTTMEAMACEVPCVVPDWSALGDWARDAAYLVPCTSTAVGPPYVNVIGGIADEAEFVKGLQELYESPELRMSLSEDGANRMAQPQFRWPNIGQAVSDEIDAMLQDRTIAKKEAFWADLGRPADEVTA